MSTDVAFKPSRRALVSAAGKSAPDLGRSIAVGMYRDARRPRSGSAPASVPRTTFDPTLPDKIANPYADLERIREHPVVVNEALNVWMIGRYDGVHAAVRENAVLSSKDGIGLQAVVTSVVATAEPPEHTRLRRIAAPLFSKRSVQIQMSDIHDLTRAALAAMKAGAAVDMVPALTIPMPIAVIARVLGVPRSQQARFKEVSDIVTSGLFSAGGVAEGLRRFPRTLQSFLWLRSFLDAEIRRRADAPAEDLINQFQLAIDAGDLADQEAFLYTSMLLVAGNETTTNLLGMLLIKLAQDHELFLQLQADRSLIPGAVEEMLRWGAPVQWVTRVATAPYEIGGTVIPTGAKVMLLNASANRDPAKFADPDRFDIHRNTSGHLGFGYGLHFCLGAHLARLETITAINYLLDEVDGLELAGPVRWGTTPSLQGPVSVPLRIRRS
ncbi:cytochrome P450 [Mycobacterium sp. smrl_JER01]|uniref:cytochrome P450 n=1 Tax=Mycobacterium sp. smrl_JER01 TaxID=3402633 RepID=UPI003ACBD01D